MSIHPAILAAAAPATDRKGEVEFNPSLLWERIDAMLDGFVKLLPNLAIGVVVFFGFVLLGKLAKKLIKRAFGSGEKQNLGIALGRVSSWALLLAGLLVATTIIAPSVSPADLLATLGIGGVAIGFAFKDILQNFLAGLLILIRQPFKIGDQIIAGSHEGTVESIETRSTLLKTYDGRRVVIPNGVIFMESVIVNTAYDARRSQYDVGIGCGDSIDKARQVIMGAIESVEGVLADPAPQVLAMDLADSANILRARWWTKSMSGDLMGVRDRVITQIEAALRENAIDMPYPTQVVLFHDQTEEVDGIRSKQREGWPSVGDKDPQPRRIGESMGERKQPHRTNGEIAHA